MPQGISSGRGGSAAFVNKGYVDSLISGGPPGSGGITEGEADLRYLRLTGGDLTGATRIVATGNAGFTLMKGTPGSVNQLYGAINPGGSRWRMLLGDSVAETGGNSGSDFHLQAYTDAAASIGSYLSIRRSDCAIAAPLTTPGGFVGPGINTVNLFVNGTNVMNLINDLIARVTALEAGP
jgi:hypothetical protein